MVLPILAIIAGGLFLWRLTKHQCPKCRKLVNFEIKICPKCSHEWTK